MMNLKVPSDELIRDIVVIWKECCEFSKNTGLDMDSDFILCGVFDELSCGAIGCALYQQEKKDYLRLFDCGFHKAIYDKIMSIYDVNKHKYNNTFNYVEVVSKELGL